MYLPPVPRGLPGGWWSEVKKLSFGVQKFLKFPEFFDWFWGSFSFFFIISKENYKKYLAVAHLLSYWLMPLCPILNSPRLQAHILVGDCLRGHGLCRHLPLQQHHRLHERDRGDDGRHDDGPPLRGLLSLCGCLQYQPGVSFKMLSGKIKSGYWLNIRKNCFWYFSLDFNISGMQKCKL